MAFLKNINLFKCFVKPRLCYSAHISQHDTCSINQYELQHDLHLWRMPMYYSKLCKSTFLSSVNTTELQLFLFKNKAIIFFSSH